MARHVLPVLAILLICSETILAFIISPTYWELRKQLVMEEKQQYLGGDLVLGPLEIKANEVLMTAKNREITNGFNDTNQFLPAHNFMEVIPKIEKSQVFQILRDMPKGGNLHCHDTALVSFDYRFYNLTYRDNLYVCDVNGTLNLHFFDTPDDKCDWELLSEVRRNSTEADIINERIKRQMTMMTEDPRRAYDSVDKAWEKFNSIFMFITPLLTYKPIYEEQFYQALQEFYDDNVMYVEVRATLSKLYALNGTIYKSMEYAKVHKDVAERFIRDHPDFIGVKLIYAPSRFIDENKIDDYLKTLTELKRAYPDFIAGFDLVGQEDKGQPLALFADKLKLVDPEINFFFHAGETNWNGMLTDMNLFDAFLLNTKRIGHGYALTKHPLIWDFVKKLNIAIEIAPISNQVLGLVEDMRNHPASTLFASDTPVVIANDDPGLWGAKALSYDFYEAFMGIMNANADLRSLKKLAQNSLVYSSMDDTQRHDAMIRWQAKWNVFVKKLASSSTR